MKHKTLTNGAFHNCPHCGHSQKFKIEIFNGVASIVGQCQVCDAIVSVRLEGSITIKKANTRTSSEKTARRIVRLRDAENLSWSEIVQILEKEKILNASGNSYTIDAVRKLYIATYEADQAPRQMPSYLAFYKGRIYEVKRLHYSMQKPKYAVLAEINRAVLVSALVLLESTGELDKNRQMIYQDDILKNVLNEPYKVFWSSHARGWRLMDCNGRIAGNEIKFKHLERSGSVHELGVMV